MNLKKAKFKKYLVFASLFVIGAVTAVRWVAAAQAPQSQGQGQNQDQDDITVPESSVEHDGDEGVRAHTNHMIVNPRKHGAKPEAGNGAPSGETPASLGCVYNLPGAIGGASGGCKISDSIANPTGGSGVIAIVDAYDYPAAASDLQVFSKQFGLPDCTVTGCFSVMYASGTKPPADCGWNQEAALDIEWAHAMAPAAKIVLVEAASASLGDLLTAVTKASQIPGVTQVSMSWGSGEFVFESFYDSYFNKSGVSFFAASGDTGGKTIWPGVSPNVISAGGTRVNRSATDGSFASETAWSGSGGGASKYEQRPAYQNVVRGIVGSKRGTPDFSFDADPSTGVSVYDSILCSGYQYWMVFGGTSVSAPSLAGIVNQANKKLGSGNSASWPEQTLIYTGYPNYTTSTFRDILSGKAGSFSAGTGWDFTTGVGSSQGLNGK
jgi:kumamolisin